MTRHLHIVSPVATQENRCVVDLRPNLNNQLVEAEWVQAMPSARAADASHSSLLRVSTVGGIAIAAFAALYFIAEFLR